MSLKTNCQICQSSIGRPLSAENRRKLQHCLEGLQYSVSCNLNCFYYSTFRLQPDISF